MFSDDFLARIKRHEGYRGDPYTCSEGVLTVGYGTTFPLTKAEAEWLLQHRLKRFRADLHQALPWLENHPEEVQEILLEMAYQMGIHGVLKFKKTLHLVESGDYVNAGFEMLDSQWADQTPNRARALSAIMQNQGRTRHLKGR